jgi:hypothetical protein
VHSEAHKPITARGLEVMEIKTSDSLEGVLFFTQFSVRLYEPSPAICLPCLDLPAISGLRGVNQLEV